MKNPAPSVPQLRAWRANEVTDWVIRQLIRRFPDYKSLIPIDSVEKASQLNYRAGSLQVLEALDRLIEHGEC